jgi:butyrate kinase
VAYYENKTCIFAENLKHSIEELKQFSDLLDQYQYRYDAIMALLEEKNFIVGLGLCY